MKALWRLFSTLAVLGPVAIAGVVLAERRWPDSEPLAEVVGWIGAGESLGIRSPWFWLLAVLAAGLVVSPLWPALRYAETLVHEMGHAYVAGLLGALPARITIEADHSGLAQWRGRKGRVRNAVATFSGYPWPVVVGVGAIVCASVGAGRAWVLWAAIIVGVLVPMMARNLIAIAVSLASVVVLTAVLWFLPVVAPALAVVVGMLLVDAGVRSGVGLLRMRDLSGSDAERLRHLIFIPARAAAFAMMATIAAVIVAGVWALVAVGG